MYPAIEFEALANEFCVSHSNTCPYRMDCYNTQSHGILKHYYFEICSKYREDNPVAWILAPIIFPEWMDIYAEKTGLASFKLTGRTLPENILLGNVIRWMLKDTGECDIRQLWGTPLPGQNFNGQMIPAKEFANSNLLENFLPTFPCEKLRCGVECRRCHLTYKQVMHKNKLV